MGKRDLRKRPIMKVKWVDAFGETNSTIGKALADNSLIKQTTIGHVSKNNKKLVQVLTSTEDIPAPIEDANCDYVNIPKSWVLSIEPVAPKVKKEKP